MDLIERISRQFQDNTRTTHDALEMLAAPIAVSMGLAPRDSNRAPTSAAFAGSSMANQASASRR